MGLAHASDERKSSLVHTEESESVESSSVSTSPARMLPYANFSATWSSDVRSSCGEGRG